MEIIAEERTYEGVHAIPSLVMAAMETSGIREYLDECCLKADPEVHRLSAGMAVKAMVGAMVERGKRPLYRMSDYYSTAPADKLFGPMAKNSSLSDTVLASRLDTVFRLDMQEVQLGMYEMLKKKYGFETTLLFLDATNYTMFGQCYLMAQAEHDMRLREKGIEVAESPMPAYGGNAKDGHNERVQLNMSHVVDNIGAPMVSKSYDGNTSDVTMNRDMIEFLTKHIDMKSVILMADCKLCVADILSSLISSEAAFVTKVPASFNGKLRDAVIASLEADSMDENPDRPGRKHYETTDKVGGEDVRIIAYVLPGAEKDSERFIRGVGLEKAKKKLKSLKRQRFFCKDDAMEAFRQALKGMEADCYAADPVVYEDAAAERRHKDGMRFRVRSDNVRVDESKLADAVRAHSVQVLITNLPFSSEHSEDRRKRASADDVIDLYLEEYKTEAGFKMMKSGMNIGNVYIHTPSRITAVAFVVSLATMICKVLDHVLEETRPSGERRRTMKALADIHLNTIVKYDRAHDRLSVMGSPGATGDFFTLVDRLQIDPQHLLGH